MPYSIFFCLSSSKCNQRFNCLFFLICKEIAHLVRFMFPSHEPKKFLSRMKDHVKYVNSLVCQKELENNKRVATTRHQFVMMGMTTTKRSVVDFGQEKRKGHVFILKENYFYLIGFYRSRKKCIVGYRNRTNRFRVLQRTQHIATGDWYTVADLHVVR